MESSDFMRDIAPAVRAVFPVGCVESLHSGVVVWFDSRGSVNDLRHINGRAIPGEDHTYTLFVAPGEVVLWSKVGYAVEAPYRGMPRGDARAFLSHVFAALDVLAHLTKSPEETQP